jgi:cytochrome c-type biogenesis protein CcmH
MKFPSIWLFTLLTVVPNGAQKNQIHRIEGKLMAPCCYSQTIDVHDSEVARQMRGEVTTMVMAGKSEQEVLDYYKTEYGESILAVPDGAAGTLVFSVPAYATVFAVLALLYGMVITVRRRPRAILVRSTGMDESALQALQARVREEWSRGV